VSCILLFLLAAVKPTQSFTSFLQRNTLLRQRLDKLAYEANDASKEISASITKVQELEAQYWAQLSPAEKEAETNILFGMDCLKEGAFAKSLTAFDRVLEIKGSSAYLWHRGIPLYYLGRYREAAEHFEKDALTYATRFEDAPTIELLWAAAARAQLGEPPIHAEAMTQGGTAGSSDGGDSSLSAELTSSVTAVARADAIQVQLDALEKEKTKAAAAEDFVEAQRLKEEVVKLREAATEAAAEAARTTQVAARGSLTDFIREYPENNPVFAVLLELFVAAWHEGGEPTTVSAAPRPARESEIGPLVKLESLVESSRVSKGGAPAFDPMGRAFLGHFFAGLFFESVRRDDAAAAQHMECARREVRASAGRSASFLSQGGILEALAEQTTGGQQEAGVSFSQAPWK